MSAEEVTLEMQKDYFEVALQQDPADETVRFALAQVLKEMDLEAEANRLYDEGIAHLDRLWFPKLISFAAISVGIAVCLYLFVVPWLWLAIPVALAGPVMWGVIRRNRRQWMPQVGFSQRASTLENADIPGELRRLQE